MSDLAAGTHLGRYRIDGVAGRGGMGVVYRAFQEDLERSVALKVITEDLAQDHDFRARFEREAKLAASLDHPNVVPVYEAGQHDGALFIAMRFVDGTDLASVVERDGALPPERAIALVTQIAGALDAAHARGLVHRDVKPHNVLMAGDHAYLTDFGLTKTTSSAGLTRTGVVLGTLDYAPPEQLRGEATDARSDVYALACMTYHLLAGAPPFERAGDTARMLAHLNDPPPDLPAGPPPLSAVIQQGMAKAPSDRFASAGEFAAACAAALTGGAAANGGPAPDKRTSRSAAAGATAPGMSPRTRMALGVALPLVLVCGLVAAALAAFGVFGGSDDPKEPEAAAPTAKPAETPAATASAEPTADDGGAPSGAAPRPVASIPVGDGPDGIAVGADVIWVVTSKAGQLVRIDAKSNKVTGEPVAAGEAPDSVTADKGIVYVTSQKDDQLRRFEARPDPVPSGTVNVGRVPESVSLGKQLVWVALSGDGTVQRVDRASIELLGGAIGVGGRPTGIHVGDGRVWVTNAEDGTISLIDSATAEPIGLPTRVGEDPRDVVEAFGFAWVVLAGDSAVVRLDLKTAKVVGSPIKVGKQPVKIAAGEGAVWVSNRGDDTVSQIDPKTFRVAGRPLPVGTRPVGIAAGLGGVWVANSGDGTVTKLDPGAALAK